MAGFNHSRGQARCGHYLYGEMPENPSTIPKILVTPPFCFISPERNWTVPSMGWEETSLAMFAGDWEGARVQVESVYDAMKRLNARRMVVTECGHAYRATVIEGPYWAGLKSGKTPVETLHYIEWVAEALRSGKLKIDPARKIKEPVTYQDSCNYVRNGGPCRCRQGNYGLYCRGFSRNVSLPGA